MIIMKIASGNSALESLQFKLAAMAGGKSLELTAGAMELAAKVIRGAWLEVVAGKRVVEGMSKPLKLSPNSAREYAGSIHTRSVGFMEHEIYTGSGAAKKVRDGTPQTDMKDEKGPWLSGPRSRVSKGGNSTYLIIPMRWGTPDSTGFNNVMPLNVYEIAKNFEMMNTLADAKNPGNSNKTPNARGEPTGRSEYNNARNTSLSGFKRYDRLDTRLDKLEGLTEKETSRMNGMVRSWDSSGKNKSAGYVTFRVLSTKSPSGSWIRKEVPGIDIARGVAAYSKNTVNKLVATALRGDLGL